MKPKPTENKAKDVEKTPRAKLEQELGRLTFELAKLKEVADKKLHRSNQLAQALDALDSKNKN